MISVFKKTGFTVKLLLASGLLLAGGRIFANDARVYSDIKSAYYSGAFPAAIEYAITMEEEYPRSLLLGKALSFKGRSYFRLGRYEDACLSLTKACQLASGDEDLLCPSLYWLGRAYAARQEDTYALNAFYESCRIFRNRRPDSLEEYYYLSLMNAAGVFYSQNKFGQAVELLETCLSGGDKFSSDDFNSVVLMLFDSYLNDGKNQRLLDVYQRIDTKKLDEITAASLSLDAGSAYENLGQYKKAYGQYVKVLSGSDSVMASLALQKAYNVASLHRKEVGEDPGTVLEKARGNLREYDSLLAEFWTRFAADAYEEKNYAKCKTYLDNAESADSSGTYTALIGLYRARLDSANTVKILDDYVVKSSLSEDDEYYPAYRLLYARSYAFEGKWDEALFNAGEAYSKSVSQASLYLYALSLYKKGDYKKAEEILQGRKLESHELNLLYAQILARNGKTEKSAALYRAHRDYLNGEQMADFSKVLFLEGALTSSFDAALDSTVPDANYMAALSAFNRRDWKTAEKYFSKYLSVKNRPMEAYAMFYNGYVQYKTGQSLSACTSLNTFVQKYSSHSLAWNACVVGARAALQNSDLQTAEKFAKKAVDASRTKDQKENAVLLYASIYSDAGESEKAVAVLNPYLKEKSDFGVRCRFETARLYAKLNKIEDSDSLYRDIQNNFTSSSLADEASFRRGELYYTKGEYPQAVSRFTEYQKKFPSGNFLDASYFFIADSYAKNNQTNRAVNQYKILKEAFPDSSYIYSAQKNLAELYRAQASYDLALAEARSIVQNFPVEAKADGITEELDELKKLLAGESEKGVRLQKDYEDAGKSSTEKGRAIGTELCELLWEDASTQKDAAILAEELFAIQSKKSNENREAAFAARTALIAAQYNRASGDAKSAADYYLKAANYAVGTSNHKLAQRVLYGAVEAFDFAGYQGDARSTAAKLHELYADSEYDKRSQKLIANYGE
ncbi:tetratricopeptide repeat protein [Treponema sp.]|uniref:tetratricopeptide repeat protein n=1 Tax=Treponema sp. TaxID=166 RepID=UPI0025E655F4|nr:tetratricopeptide repeat protein [Treponema sp.]MCR5217131.1 tetratricopeptide repeat protein [Treponema sp.]